MSYESVQTRIFLQQYLVNQLITTNNVYTKVKILRLFITLLEDGHIEFRQNLRKRPEPFNEAMSESLGGAGRGGEGTGTCFFFQHSESVMTVYTMGRDVFFHAGKGEV